MPSILGLLLFHSVSMAARLEPQIVSDLILQFAMPPPPIDRDAFRHSEPEPLVENCSRVTIRSPRPDAVAVDCPRQALTSHAITGPLAHLSFCRTARGDESVHP